LALTGLARVGGDTHDRPLERGLDWLNGANELNRPLVSDAPTWYPRAIQRRGSDPDAFGGMSRPAHGRLLLASLIGSARDERRRRRPRLEVLCEDRSYHLGWILLAAALVRDASPPASS
jgi:hypothetical protein